MLRKHWRTGVTRKRVLMTLGSSLLLLRETETQVVTEPITSAHKIYWLAQTVSSLPGRKAEPSLLTVLIVSVS